MRTKAQIHSLEGHTNTVATVKCQEIEPQVREKPTLQNLKT
jgi:pleiotropic regulator 1